MRPAGAIRTRFLIFELYSGLSDNAINGKVPPKEMPATSTLEYPVTDMTKSIAAGKSYTPNS